MAGIPLPPLLWEPPPSSHAPTPRQTPVPDGDDLRVSRPLLLRSLPRYYISVVGDSCPEISFSEANRKEDNGMNDFRIIQKPSAGKDEAYGQEETRRNREGYGHTAEAL